MSTTFLTVIVMGTTVAVVIALFLIMWRERQSDRDGAVALASGGVLASWTALVTVLAMRGGFLSPGSRSVPPVGIALVGVLVGIGAALSMSESLRRLLTSQQSVIRLNVWRVIGVVFLLLLASGEVPAVWALPTAIGDIIVGLTAFWVASQLDSPAGRRRAIIFNLFGLADLVVAIGLGVMTSPGLLNVIRTSPTTELMTRFPMVLVPTFLVPLAIMLHVVSLWQLLSTSWASQPAAALARGR
ncbi:MAG: hypothetical protein ACM4AI_20990 [Acidobacteriota bacterium]